MPRALQVAAIVTVCLSGPSFGQSAANSTAATPGLTAGQRASAASSLSDAAMLKAEREAAIQRRADEERYRRRDQSMKKSLGSICKGC